MPSTFKRFRHALGGVFFDIMDSVIPHIPIPVLYTGLDILFFLAYPILSVVPTYRKTVVGNLDIAFGSSLPKREKRAVARRAARNLMNIPVISVHYVHPKNLPKVLSDVEFVGLEHLTGALDKGRGVIGLGAHLGNFILLNVALAQTDLPFVAVTKEPRPRPLALRYQRWKRACGLEWIDADARAAATKSILKALKTNRIVLLIADERKKRDGIVVPFFGRPALTAPGPAVLSLRTGSPIVPIFITERERYRHTIEVLPEIECKPTGDTERDIHALTERANEVIADYIGRYPDQWAWVNRRWKI
jgi:KDO2-lipid IV(A) lauroyltransferase